MASLRPAPQSVLSLERATEQGRQGRQEEGGGLPTLGSSAIFGFYRCHLLGQHHLCLILRVSGAEGVEGTYLGSAGEGQIFFSDADRATI